MSGAALITGGEGDLARAIASRLAEEGWQVATPGRGELDVVSEVSVAAYFEKAGKLDLLVANAGAIDDLPIAKLTEASWDRILDVNLKGAFLTVRAALPLLKESRGSIVLIGSRAGRRGGTGNSHYAAAKAGLIGLAQSLARELGPDGVRCNVVLPGFLETKMTAGLPAAVVDGARDDHALGRFNTVGEAARGVVFVGSLAHVSGQVFQLDSRIDRWT